MERSAHTALLLILLSCPCAAEPRRSFRRRIVADLGPSSQEVEIASPLTGEEDVWQVWSWSVPIPHTDGAMGCRWARLEPPATPGLRRPENGTVCLRQADDLLCNAIVREHYWSECADLPSLYAKSSESAGGGGLFLDVGANIGACSLHMLLSTDAPVIALEPSPNNLFYAGSSLLRLSQDLPDTRLRLTLLPLAVGSENSSSSLYSAIGNAGHSVIALQPKQYAPLGAVARFNVAQWRMALHATRHTPQAKRHTPRVTRHTPHATRRTQHHPQLLSRCQL